MPSVGESAARGLESGVRLAMDITEAQRRAQRETRLDDQSQQVFAAHMEDRANAQTRQTDADAMAATDAQLADLRTQGPGLVNATPEAQAAWRQQIGAAEEGRRKLLVKRGAPDTKALADKARASVEAVKSGQVSDPETLVAGVAGATGHPISFFLPDKDGVAPAQRSAMKVLSGQEQQNMPMILEGLNESIGPQLQRNLGKETQHGGKAVFKEIVGLTPDPNSPSDDPRYIPVIRTYIDRGKDFRGPKRKVGNGVEADGHYDAPMTQGGSADSKADPLVQSLSLKRGMGYLDNQLKLAEGLAAPEAQKYLAGYLQQGGSDGTDFAAALAEHGLRAPTNTTKNTSIGSGGLLRETYDAQGNKIGESVIQPPPKESAQGGLQQDISTIQRQVDAKLITQAEADRLKRSALEKDSTRAPKGGGAGGGGEGGGGLSKADERAVKAQQAQIKSRLDRLKENKADALKKYEIDIKGKPKRVQQEREAEYRSAVSTFDAQIQNLEEQDSKLGDQLTGVVERTPGLAGARPAPAPANSGKGYSSLWK